MFYQRMSPKTFELIDRAGAYAFAGDRWTRADASRFIRTQRAEMAALGGMTQTARRMFLAWITGFKGAERDAYADRMQRELERAAWEASFPYHV